MNQIFEQLVKDIISEKYPFDYQFSECKKYQWLQEYRKGKDIRILIHQTLQHLSKNMNYPFVWFDKGYTVEESLYYAANMKTNKYRFCAWCDKPFPKNEGRKSCCCEEHYLLQMQRRNTRLSESRLKYNARDPIQYAERNNISIEEAERIIRKITTEGSQYRKEFWLKKGYSEEEAKNEISKAQSKVSKRHPAYWIKRGYTEEEAKKKVSEVQSRNSKIGVDKYTKEERIQRSYFAIEYWLKKGYSEEEARNIISTNSKKGSNAVLSKYTSDERRTFNVRCVEYWQEKYPNNWLEKYEEFLTNSSLSPLFRSKIADEFVSKLSRMFPNEKIYCLDNEFGIYGDGKYFKVDFVNFDRKICVEFFGNYWHANPNLYKADDEIRFPKNTIKIAKDIWEHDKHRIEQITNRGLKVFIVWESDYLQNKDQCIQKIFEDIINANH